MSFNTSITGLNAAQKDLDVTSNNIANANSTGFKQSRAQFGDIYAVSAYGNSKTASGQGVLTEAVQQQFSQGSLQFTNNSLDLAITGQGFFAFQPALDSQQSVYSRAGALGVNKDGFIVNASGQYLKALPVTANGSLKSTSLASASPIQLPVAAGAPIATTTVTQSFNLPANATAPTVAFNPTQATPDPASYTQANSQQVYDSLGNTHTLTSYYVKTANPNEWNVYYQVDTQTPSQGPSTLTSVQHGGPVAEWQYDRTIDWDFRGK
jgi:flagellar hook protein FlgE